jgi:transcriptional regulator with XRE-family HTH domain
MPRQALRHLTVGQRIRRNRLERGLTQEQLARLLNVSAVTVSRWERDKFIPEDSNPLHLARELGGTPQDYNVA